MVGFSMLRITVPPPFEDRTCLTTGSMRIPIRVMFQGTGACPWSSFLPQLGQLKDLIKDQVGTSKAKQLDTYRPTPAPDRKEKDE